MWLGVVIFCPSLFLAIQAMIVDCGCILVSVLSAPMQYSIQLNRPFLLLRVSPH